MFDHWDRLKKKENLIYFIFKMMLIYQDIYQLLNFLYQTTSVDLKYIKIIFFRIQFHVNDTSNVDWYLSNYYVDLKICEFKFQLEQSHAVALV